MEVTDILPHRPPFLMVDRLLEVEPGKRAVARKCVSQNEPYLAGHFPGFPVVPGVLLVEAIAQTAALAAIGAGDEKIGVLAGIDRARFRRPVRPGDVLEITGEVQSMKRSLGRAAGRIAVDGAVVCEAEILFALRSPGELA